jgi:hypothetical protein
MTLGGEIKIEERGNEGGDVKRRGRKRGRYRGNWREKGKKC